jgi:predicted permease
MNVLHLELRNALRSVAAQPGFSALVIGVLAAGLACVLFMLVVLNGMVIRPLPFAAPERLLHLGFENPRQSSDLDDVHDRDVHAWQERLAGMADVAAYQEMTINLGDAGGSERQAGARVTPNLFELLGSVPQLGRGFLEADGKPGAPMTVLLSDALWRNRFNADPAIGGRHVRVNAADAMVIGVMPPDFSFPYKEQVWLTAAPDAHVARSDSGEWTVIARRHADASPAALEATLAAWQADARREAPRYFEERTAAIEPLSWLFVEPSTRGILNVMLLAVILVLLVACANAANLMLTRTLARRQELAVRAALGASRSRLILHLLGQSLLLAGLACAIALPLGWLGAHWVDQMFRSSEEGPPRWMHFGLDANMILFAVLAALATGLITGLLPALRAGSSVNEALRDDSRAVAGGHFARVSRALVIGEIALSCILLVAAGVLVRGIGGYHDRDFGIRPQGLLTARVGLPEALYPRGEQQVLMFERLSQRLRNDPEVVDAGMGTTLPGLISDWERVTPAGAAAEDPRVLAYTGAIDDHFASTYALRLEEGRLFNASDRADTTPVAIVDRTFAERFADGGSLPGRRFVINPDDAGSATVTVVGVVARTQLDDLDDPARPAILFPLRQQPARFVSIAVRTRGEPAAFATRLSEIVREVDADAPAYWVRTYDKVMLEAIFGQQVLAKLFTAFGLIALFLAAAGLYGVIAFSVRQRTREIGVRRALGAPATRLLRGLLRGGALQVGVGLALGLGLAWPFARALISTLQGFDAADPLVYALVLGALGGVALIAILLPARRALRVDPVVALRHE